MHQWTVSLFAIVSCFNMSCTTQRSHAQSHGSHPEMTPPSTFATPSDHEDWTGQLSDHKAEAQFLVIINEFRTQLGLSQLAIHPDAQVAAEKHSAWMDRHGTLTHLGPMVHWKSSDRLKLEGFTRYDLLGENIACGNADALETFKQWVYSPSHFDNMLTPQYSYIGIARRNAVAGANSCPYYWTTDFVSLADEEDREIPKFTREKVLTILESMFGEKPDADNVIIPDEMLLESIGN